MKPRAALRTLESRRTRDSGRIANPRGPTDSTRAASRSFEIRKYGTQTRNSKHETRSMRLEREPRACETRKPRNRAGRARLQSCRKAAAHRAASAAGVCRFIPESAFTRAYIFAATCGFPCSAGFSLLLCSKNLSMKVVSTRPARKSGSARILRCNGMVV